MNRMLAALLLLPFAGPSRAEAEPRIDARRVTPEQYPGQLERLRLTMLYPKFVAEPDFVPASEPAARFDAYLAALTPVLKNVDRLNAYLRAGLKDPAAVRGDRARWDAAWTRLDEESARLRPLIAVGEDLLREPVPAQGRWRPTKEGYRPLEDAPECDTPEGRRLHQSAVRAAYAQNLREYLLRKSSEAKVRARLGDKLP